MIADAGHSVLWNTHAISVGMKSKGTLVARTVSRFVLGFLIGSALLFVPAGSLHFWHAWIFVIGYLGIWIVFSFLLLKWDPQLMERRLQYKEAEPEQRLFQKLWALLFPALALPRFDFRFHWSKVPVWLAVTAQAMMMVSSLLIFWVLRTNTFAGRIIHVESGQEVITTGPYAIVRHPMHAGILLTLLAIPLALGSYLAHPFFLVLVLLILFRLIHEERTLRRDLPGYEDYCLHTRFRLVPGLW